MKMKSKLLLAALSMFLSLPAADKSISVYGGVSRGNIARENLDPLNFPVVGVIYRQAYKRLVLQGGLFVKRVGGSWTLPLTTKDDPDGLYTSTKVQFLADMAGLSLGIHDMLVQSGKFSLSLGINVDNAFLMDPHYKSEYSGSSRIKGLNPHYIAVTPQLGIDYKVSAKKSIFMNLALSEQLNKLMKSDHFFYYHIRHVQLDIGFSYRLGKGS